MRKIISWEGEEKVKDILIERGGLTWEEPLPLVWNYNFTVEHLLGKAVDLRREDDGSVTAEIIIEDESDVKRSAMGLLKSGEVACAVYCNQLKEKDRRTTGRKRIVTEARIRSVSLILSDNVGWD